jgi:hypothetical protein
MYCGAASTGSDSCNMGLDTVMYKPTLQRLWLQQGASPARHQQSVLCSQGQQQQRYGCCTAAGEQQQGTIVPTQPLQGTHCAVPQDKTLLWAPTPAVTRPTEAYCAQPLAAAERLAAAWCSMASTIT